MTPYYFTFGFAHYNGDGTPLRNRYCVIEAEDEQAARARMFAVRDQKWCTSCLTPEEAGVGQFGLTPIALADLTPQGEYADSFD